MAARQVRAAAGRLLLHPEVRVHRGAGHAVHRAAARPAGGLSLRRQALVPQVHPQVSGVRVIRNDIELLRAHRLNLYFNPSQLARRALAPAAGEGAARVPANLAARPGAVEVQPADRLQSHRPDADGQSSGAARADRTVE